MVFVPVHNAGEGYFFGQGIEVDLNAHGTEPQIFGSITQPQKAASFAGGLREVADLLQGNGFTIVFADDTKARRSAVFGIRLKVKGKGFQFLIILYAINGVILATTF